MQFSWDAQATRGSEHRDGPEEGTAGDQAHHATRPRPTFGLAGIAEHALPAVRLASGGSGPRLVAVGPFAGRSGAPLYRALAGQFEGGFDFWALTPPGFGARPELPADLETLIGLHVEAITGLPGQGPLILAGHSSGGWLAHELAAHLERAGDAPRGVVIVDSYMAGTDQFRACSPYLAGALDHVETLFGTEQADAWTSAMDHYVATVFGDWVPSVTSAPTVLLRAAEPLPKMPVSLDWRVRWLLPHDLVEVPGNHFTMLRDGARRGAAAVRALLT